MEEFNPSIREHSEPPPPSCASGDGRVICLGKYERRRHPLQGVELVDNYAVHCRKMDIERGPLYDITSPEGFLLALRGTLRFDTTGCCGWEFHAIGPLPEQSSSLRYCCKSADWIFKESIFCRRMDERPVQRSS